MGENHSLIEYEERRSKALEMGGSQKLERRRAAGVLNARERIERLADAGSFLESGLFGASMFSEADKAKTPADGKIVGYARIAGRDVALVSNDFTVMGASSSATNGKKIAQMKRVATQRGLPMVFLGESSGACMPDTMGSRGMGAMLGNDPTQYQRMRETPWAAAVLGYCFGSSAWYTCCSDFRVMRKGAIMAVSSPRLASLAIGETVEPEDLGGWQLHAQTTGLIDMVVDTDEEALDAIKRFLTYLPSHHNEAPPETSVPSGSGDAMRNVLHLLPERLHAGVRRAQGHQGARRYRHLVRAQTALWQNGVDRPCASGRTDGRDLLRTIPSLRVARSTPRRARKSRVFSCSAIHSTSRS
jgi:acetyl-CoA carboxylase carboxyltransferase component